MFEDDDDRIEAARGLAESDDRSAVEAFRSIAVDDSVDEAVRLEAARGLAEIDERSAAEACCSIAVDDSVDEPVRLEAKPGSPAAVSHLVGPAPAHGMHRASTIVRHPRVSPAAPHHR